jgi:putative copper resistance protein D
MAADLAIAQHAATVALNLALAVAVGAGATWLSVARLASRWSGLQRVGARRTATGALVIVMLSSAFVLWLQAAGMAEVPVMRGGEAAWTMLTATHLGAAWKIGIAALVFSMVAMALGARMERTRLCGSMNLLGLAVFLYTRSMVSHAAAGGDFSLPMSAQWLHLMAVCLWVGEVFVAGFFVLAALPGERQDDRNDCARYIESLSTSATVSLGCIIASGLFSAWHNLGSAAALVGNPYGTTLLAKLALVSAAATLGGVNRLMVMPKLMAALRSDSPAGAFVTRQFIAILRLEAGVLLAVLILAAILSSTSPPMAQ